MLKSFRAVVRCEGESSAYETMARSKAEAAFLIGVLFGRENESFNQNTHEFTVKVD
jgi:hypothetical protein